MKTMNSGRYKNGDIHKFHIFGGSRLIHLKYQSEESCLIF